MAITAYISIKGKKQGQFTGDGSDRKNKDRILIDHFSFSLESPRDIATGHASGKRQYSPILIRKRWGEASTQIYQAAATNEILTSVLIEFLAQAADGRVGLDHSISLTNASISAVTGFTGSTQPANDIDLHDEVRFSFERIEIKDKSGKTFADSWATVP